MSTLLSINGILVVSANENKKIKNVEISMSELLGTPHSPYPIRKFLSFGEPPLLPLPELVLVPKTNETMGLLPKL